LLQVKTAIFYCKVHFGLKEFDSNFREFIVDMVFWLMGLDAPITKYAF
jgi:hypothetical protein